MPSSRDPLPELDERLPWNSRPPGSTSNTNLFKSDGLWGQTFLPTKDAAGTQPAYALLSPAGAFGTTLLLMPCSNRVRS